MANSKSKMAKPSVKNIKNSNKNKKTYSCGECGLKYKDEKIAKKCEEWCRKHKSCNIELIKYAVK